MNKPQLLKNQDIVDLIKANPTCDKIVFITPELEEFHATMIDSDIQYYVEINVDDKGARLSSFELLSELEKDISERSNDMYLAVWVTEHGDRHLIESTEIEENTIKVLLSD